MGGAQQSGSSARGFKLLPQAAHPKLGGLAFCTKRRPYAPPILWGWYTWQIPEGCQSGLAAHHPKCAAAAALELHNSERKPECLQCTTRPRELKWLYFAKEILHADVWCLKNMILVDGFNVFQSLMKRLFGILCDLCCEVLVSMFEGNTIHLYKEAGFDVLFVNVSHFGKLYIYIYIYSHNYTYN